MLEQKITLIKWIADWKGETIGYKKRMEIVNRFSVQELERIYNAIRLTPCKSETKNFSRSEIRARKMLLFFANKDINLAA